MPRGDGTGPTGKGPMTGRGMGYCIRKTKPVKVHTSEEEQWRDPALVRKRPTQKFQPVVPDKAMLEKEKSFLLERLESLEKELEKMDQ